MFLHVTDVDYLGGYRLKLVFNNGVIKEVDLKDKLYAKIFEPLKDINLFKQVRINSTGTTIECQNGADFAPEFLYEIGEEVGRLKKEAI